MIKNDFYGAVSVFGLLIIAALVAIFCVAERSQEPPKAEATTAAQQTESTTANELPTPKEIPTESPTEAPTEAIYIRYPLTDEERAIVEAVVAAEARGEDFDGQCLVAQCILNTAEAKDWRPDKVALEPGQYASPDHEHRLQVAKAVAAVFDDGYTVVDEPIRYFYAPARCSSSWHESLDFVIEHGAHRFFKNA